MDDLTETVLTAAAIEAAADTAHNEAVADLALAEAHEAQDAAADAATVAMTTSVFVSEDLDEVKSGLVSLAAQVAALAEALDLIGSLVLDEAEAIADVGDAVEAEAIMHDEQAQEQAAMTEAVTEIIAEEPEAAAAPETAAEENATDAPKKESPKHGFRRGRR